MKQIIAPASFSDELEVLRKLDLTNCIVNRIVNHPAIDLAREQRQRHRSLFLLHESRNRQASIVD